MRTTRVGWVLVVEVGDSKFKIAAAGPFYASICKFATQSPEAPFPFHHAWPKSVEDFRPTRDILH
jgi:hypothetical protein